MIRSRNQNSFLAVATLGVYLGLILAGATPTVLAQAATAKQFNVKDEVARKNDDDVDLKPDGDLVVDQFVSAFENIYGVAAEISNDHPDWVAKGRYNFDFYVSVKPDSSSRLYTPAALSTVRPGVPRITPFHSTRPLKELYDSVFARANSWHENLLVQFDLGSRTSTFSTTVVAKDAATAAATADAYRAALDARNGRETALLKSLILKSLNISVEKDRIVLTSQLPRSDLDSLPASNAK